MQETREEIAGVIANALYHHRYPRAMSPVADRGHPSQGRFWTEADVIVAALKSVGVIEFSGSGSE